jgi:hypothetical protein
MRRPALAAPTAAPAPALALLTLAVAACGGDRPPPEARDALSQFAEAANEFANQAQKIAEGGAGALAAGGKKAVPPVSYKVLLDYLPKRVDGMKAAEPEGSTNSMGELKFSQAKGRYRAEDGGGNADVGIYDYAHIAALYAPYRMMLAMRVNTESTRGYERTTQLAGFPAYEKWEKSGAKSEIAVMVGDRFVVTVETRGVGEGAARRIAEAMDLKGLARQKDA